MISMCIGYLLPFYCLFGLFYFDFLGCGPRPGPLAPALACFIILPVLISAISAEALLSPPEGRTIREKIRNGQPTASYAMNVGLMIGFVVLGLLGSIWYFASLADTYFPNHRGGVFLVGMMVALLILFFGPAVGIAWLATRGNNPSEEKKD
jgi:hypothetical protein